MSYEKVNLFLNDQSNGNQISCQIKKSKRAKRISLRIHSKQKIILTIPSTLDREEGLSFLQKQKKWLQKNLDSAPEPLSLSEFFLDNGKVWLSAHPRKLIWSISENRNHISHEVKFDEIILNLISDHNLDFLILQSLKNIAKENLAMRLRKLCMETPLAYEKVRIGDQKSRWGSCSAKKTISLNWRLILLPYELGNYVIMHELAHTRHLNHSKEFWDFLDLICPDARILDKELKNVGKAVMSIHQKD